MSFVRCVISLLLVVAKNAYCFSMLRRLAPVLIINTLAYAPHPQTHRYLVTAGVQLALRCVTPIDTILSLSIL